MKAQNSKFYQVLILFLILSYSGIAQIVVTPSNATTNRLDSIIRRLVGSGVSISNITSNVGTNHTSFASFVDNTGGATPNPITGIKNGLVMSTGQANQLPGPNTQIGQTFGTGTGQSNVDPNLNAIATGSTNDVLRISFNFVPFADTIKFNYVFGSEEYPNFSCSNFNDVFGFFVTGPNPAGGNYNAVNVARVPIPSQPTVAVTNVTNGGCSGSCAPQNVGFFVANHNPSGCSAGPLNINYDGFTTKLTAAIRVVPCQVYTLKFAISDVSDGILDSFVAIEEGSLRAVGARVEPLSVFPRFDYVVRGCNPVKLDFIRYSCIPDSVIVKYDLAGTGINGVDYSIDPITPTPIPDSVILPVGVDTLTMTIYGVVDPNADTLKTLIMTLLDNEGLPTNLQINLNIRKTFIYETSSDVDVCGQDSALLNPSPLYQTDSAIWFPPTGLSCTNCLSPNSYPPVTTSYLLTVFDSISGCTGTDSVTVFVYSPPAPNDSSVCEGENVAITSAQSGTGNIIGYQWTPDPTIVGALNTPTINLIAATSRYYFVRVTYSLGCVNDDSVFLNVLPKPNAPDSNFFICYNDTVYMDYSASGGSFLLWQDSLGISNPGSIAPIFYLNDTTGNGRLVLLNGKVSDGVCEDPFLLTIRINAELVPGIAFSTVDSVNFDEREITLPEIFELELPFLIRISQTATGNPNSIVWFVSNAQAGIQDTIQEFDFQYLFTLPGDYYITQRIVSYRQDGDSCVAYKTIVIPVLPFIPGNTITPNGDGKNDVFKLKSLNIYSTFELKIFNRWGRLVYESSEYKDDWSGEDNSGGTYFYQVTQKPEGKSYNGFIQVIK